MPTGLVAARAFYGDMLLAIPVFFELKKKYKGIVYKRRVRMSLMGAWAFAHGASYEAAMTTYPLAEDDECGRSQVGQMTCPFVPLRPMCKSPTR